MPRCLRQSASSASPVSPSQPRISRWPEDAANALGTNELMYNPAADAAAPSIKVRRFRLIESRVMPVDP
ncbi:hypothetical protein D3C75_1023460 [compost metagenome]